MPQAERTGFSFLQGQELIASGTTQSGIIRVREAISSVVKAPELEAGHSPLCNAEDNDPHVFVVWCFIKHEGGEGKLPYCTTSLTHRSACCCLSIISMINKGR
jgi:hypothetical protein